MKYELEEKIKNAPISPGCYIYKNKNGKVLYIGKAINLKKRVSQYFRGDGDIIKMSKIHSPKIVQMVARIADVEFHTVDSEIEALILESNLIKKYKPPYNTLLKEGYNYSWIKITIQEEYPQVFVTREKLNDKSLYFGPYPSTRSVYSILKFLRRIFPFRTCYLPIPKDGQYNKSRLCFFYFLKLCNGPCDYLISRNEYRSNIKNIIRFLKGEKVKVIKQLETDMNQFARNEEFERAAYLRDKIKDLLYVSQKIRVGSEMDEIDLEYKQNFENKKGIIELFSALNLEVNKINRIECYDISNTAGSLAVGSMVVFENGIPKREDYRKFRIKNISGPNDYKMMNQVLERRLKYLVDKSSREDLSFNTQPDLILIDGGKGQLKAVLEAEKLVGVTLPTAALAKREEELFVPGNPKSIRLPKKSYGMYLIQRIRDETHRFGVTYHKSLRAKSMLESQLDEIKGIGKKKKFQLLKKYKSYNEIRAASEIDLNKIVKNKKIVEELKK